MEETKEIIGIDAGILTIENGKPYLLSSHCPKCGNHTFPQKKACPFCLNAEDITVSKVGAKGKVDSFTVCHVAPKGFEAPYTLGMVEVEHGIKVTTIIENETSKDLRDGDEVELIVAPTSKDENDEDIIGWKYRVAEGGAKNE